MSELRQKFEELPDIKGIIYGSDFGFNESLNQYYHPDHTNHRLNYAFIMGAWCAFQSRQAEIDQLKTQLNNMEACYIQKKKEYEGLQDRVEGVLSKMLTKAESLQQGCDGYIDPVELCQAEGIEMCMRFLEKALRGEHESN